MNRIAESFIIAVTCCFLSESFGEAEAASHPRIVFRIDRIAYFCGSPQESSCPVLDSQGVRLRAAHLFVDSLASRDSLAAMSMMLVPKLMILNCPLTLYNLHADIAYMRCTGTVDEYPFGDRPLPCTAKRMASQRLDMSELLKWAFRRFHYDTLLAGQAPNDHVVAITDANLDYGFDPVTSDLERIVHYFHERYPGRPRPKVHIVCMADSTIDYLAAYPRCTTGYWAPDYAGQQALVDSFGGTYWNVNETTVVPAVMALLDTILASVGATHAGDGMIPTTLAPHRGPVLSVGTVPFGRLPSAHRLFDLRGRLLPPLHRRRLGGGGAGVVVTAPVGTQ